jgi:nicotinamidase-related amidase
VLDKIKKALEASRAAKVQVIYLNWCMRPGYPKLGDPLFQIPIMVGVFKGGLDATWTQEKGYSKGYYNPDEIKPAPQDYIVDNWATDGFLYTDLELILRAQGITNVICTGIATDWVIHGTVRHGAEIGYNMIVVADCCQSFNDQMHDHQTNTILPQLAVAVVKLDEYLAALP